jgi:hypothetical protein
LHISAVQTPLVVLLERHGGPEAAYLLVVWRRLCPTLPM